MLFHVESVIPVCHLLSDASGQSTSQSAISYLMLVVNQHQYGPVLYREDGWNANSSVAGIGSDWFEGALVRPDLVLSDVARALNSSAVPGVCTYSSPLCVADASAACTCTLVLCMSNKHLHHTWVWKVSAHAWQQSEGATPAKIVYPLTSSFCSACDPNHCLLCSEHAYMQ